MAQILAKIIKTFTASRVVVPYGKLNAQGREKFMSMCESVYFQTKYEHPHYPELKPYMVASICKRFLGTYIAEQEKFLSKTKLNKKRNLN